uniref:Uncharacterized protein n=1 Tax=Candidatus Kentrum sp. TC TaxID=2126339 RepID=A0A450YTR5_9GAMM|nr:MAG: hypothetical protein BECKTC1821D_GA0114238_102232 [Candidatus Kentron sp. TC]
MRKILYIPLLVVLAIVVAAITPMVAGWLYTDIERIDRDFEGIFGIDTGNKTASGDSPRVEKTIHLLIIHGIGRHCIGYADNLTTGIARHASFFPATDKVSPYLSPKQCGKDIASDDFDNKQDKVCDLIRQQDIPDRDCQHFKMEASYIDPASGESGTSTFFLGYIRTQDYAPKGHANGVARLRLHELTWDPATRWAKNFYVQEADDISNYSRAILNRKLKQRIINESISDAVLYLGQYRPMMQYPLLMSFCKIMSDAVGISSRNDKGFTCDLRKIADRLDSPGALEALALEAFFEKNEIVIMTHSLGTRMLFDTLGLIGHDDFVSRFKKGLAENGITIEIPTNGPIRTRRVLDIFGIAIDKVFTLANQVPLLELGRVIPPTSFDVDLDLGTGFDRFVKRRVDGDELSGYASPLQLVAFTDPNDLLSYNLKCWYYLRVLREHDELRDQDGLRISEKTEQERKKFFENYFNSCEVEQKDKTGEFISAEKKIRAGFWKAADRYVRISDVTANLKGIRYPLLFADPSGAHSQYFEDETIFGLIACGGASGTAERISCKIE